MKPESQKWMNLVNETCHTQGLSYDEAWNQCRRTHPSEHAAMADAGKTTAEIANERLIAGRKIGIEAKEEARYNFHRAVNDRMAKYGETYDTAYSRCQFVNAELYNVATEQGSPVYNVQRANMMGLTYGDKDEYDAAFIANGCKVSPVDHKAVLDGLVDYHAKKKGISKDSAKDFVLATHPLLSQILVDQKSANGGQTTNSDMTAGDYKKMAMADPQNRNYNGSGSFNPKG